MSGVIHQDSAIYSSYCFVKPVVFLPLGLVSFTCVAAIVGSIFSKLLKVKIATFSGAFSAIAPAYIFMYSLCSSPIPRMLDTSSVYLTALGCKSIALPEFL